MVRIAVIQFLLISGIFSDVCFGESAWQIELLGKAETDAAVVRLGDVGLVHGLPPHEAQVLNRIVLTPGPRPTVRRSLSATQVRKMLQGRGVDLTGCQMIGAARTVVCFKAHAATDTEPDTAGVKQAETSPWDVVRPASYRTREGMRVVKNTEEQLAEAVREKLSELSGDESVWHVTVAVEPRGLKAISADWESVSVDGLSIASEGRHRLVAHFLSHAGNSQLAFEAVVVRQVQMVVPTRPLRRGETISASDIELQHVIGESLQQTSATSETEVVGRQVQTPLRAGEPIPRAASEATDLGAASRTDRRCCTPGRHSDLGESAIARPGSFG